LDVIIEKNTMVGMRDGIRELSDGARQDGGAKQDHDQQAPELVKEPAPGWTGRFLGEPVEGIDGEACTGIGLG
jgi:hypothetical protein